MILKNKNAIIYGAGGSIGGALARAFAQAGARVFLTGHKSGPLQTLVDQIRAAGGHADVDQVDATDEKAVNDHMSKTTGKAGTVDISFNVIGLQVVQNIPLVMMNVEDFVRPAGIALRSHFLTATAAGKVMMQQRSGVILSLTATPGGIGYPFTAGFAPACAAMESFSRNLGSELGLHGVRVVNIRSAGSPDSKVFKDALAANPDVVKPILEKMENDTMLKRLPSMANIANTAIFLASDMAFNITGVTIDVTGGTTTALNYRARDNAF